jgi:hypothetical protein
LVKRFAEDFKLVERFLLGKAAISLWFFCHFHFISPPPGTPMQPSHFKEVAEEMSIGSSKR